MRHEGPFEYVHTAKPDGICLTRVMSDRPFSPLSYVGSLPLWRLSLGICRTAKMLQRLIAGTDRENRSVENREDGGHVWEPRTSTAISPATTA